jgi:hypothetical protein
MLAAAMSAGRQENPAPAITRLEILLAHGPPVDRDSGKADVARLRQSRMPSGTDF